MESSCSCMPTKRAAVRMSGASSCQQGSSPAQDGGCCRRSARLTSGYLRSPTKLAVPLSRSSSITTRKLVTSSRRWPHWYTVYSVSTQRRQRTTTTSAGTPHAIARRGSEFGEVVANSLQAISRRLFLRGSRHFQNLIRGSGGLTVQSRDGMEAEPGSDMV